MENGCHESNKQVKKKGVHKIITDRSFAHIAILNFFFPWHKISFNCEGQFRIVENPTPKLVDQPLYYILWFLF